VGDLVLINFIGGDINAPIITGRLYDDEQRPPLNKNNEFLLQHSVKNGGSIKLDDKGKIIITSKDEENILTVEDEKVSVMHEKFSIIIDGDKISITSDKDLALSAKNGKFVIDAQQIEITSANALKIDAGAGMDIKASGAMKLEGSTIYLN
jgi:uncharacterized protein involved in type VI secretion and phage assembly